MNNSKIGKYHFRSIYRKRNKTLAKQIAQERVCRTFTYDRTQDNEEQGKLFSPASISWKNWLVFVRSAITRRYDYTLSLGFYCFPQAPTPLKQQAKKDEERSRSRDQVCFACGCGFVSGGPGVKWLRLWLHRCHRSRRKNRGKKIARRLGSRCVFVCRRVCDELLVPVQWIFST